MLFVFFFKKLKNVLSLIIACFKISAYPQMISLFGKDLSNSVSEITTLGL